MTDSNQPGPFEDQSGQRSGRETLDRQLFFGNQAPATRTATKGDLATAQSALTWEPGSSLLDAFEILSKLGQGGMGEVWWVRNPILEEDYALKRALLTAPSARRDFMAELITWISLPDHPNIVTCRFFRTVGDELLIFSEYIDGGSLAEFIRKRNYELTDVVEIAIQFARGLLAAHEQEVIHQDIKPANVLLTTKGEVKVTDFGLARARSRIDERDSHLLRNGEATCMGGTPEYFSPEQAKSVEQFVANGSDRTRLSKTTDVWSWGASVLEMIIGYRSWLLGQMAGQTLEAYLSGELEDCHIRSIPTELAAILRTALAEDSRERWQDFAAPIAALLDISNRGGRFARPAPSAPSEESSVSSAQPVQQTDRYSAWWRPAEKVITETLQNIGADPAEAAKFLLRVSGSSKSQLLANLFVYEEAIRLTSEAVVAGRTDLRESLAEMYQEKAFLQLTLNDEEGAFAAFDQTTGIYELLVQEGRSDLIKRLADCYANKSSHFSAQRGQQGIDLLDQAIERYQLLAETSDDRQAWKDLAIAYSNKAKQLFGSGDGTPGEIVELHHKAIAIIERLLKDRRSDELEADLARCYSNLGLIIGVDGDPALSVQYQDNAIELYEGLVIERQRRDLADSLAECYLKKAVYSRSDEKEYLNWLDRAIEILEPLVEQSRRFDLVPSLVICYERKASVLSVTADKSGADWFDKGIKLLEHLAYKEGVLGVVSQLVRFYQRKALAVAILFGDAPAALEYGNKAISLLERMLMRGWDADLALTLAECYKEKAVDIGAAGDKTASLVEYANAVKMLRRVITDGRTDLHERLAEYLYLQAEHAHELRELPVAESANAESIAIYESLVRESDDQELALSLANCYVLKAGIANLRGGASNGEVVDAYENSIQVLQGLVNAGRTDLIPKLNLCLEKKEIAERVLAQPSPGGDLINTQISELERQVHIDGKVELALELAELYLQRLTLRVEARADSKSIQDEVSTTVRLCDDLADAAIFGGRNDLFDQLGRYQIKLDDLARQFGS